MIFQIDSRLDPRARPQDPPGPHTREDHTQELGLYGNLLVVPTGPDYWPPADRERHWRFLDRTSGADSPTIDWRFTVGQRVKIRLVNEMDSDHPMHHPLTCTGPAGSWSWPAPAKSWTCCSTSPTRALDGPLPHRRAHAERHDVQLQRHPPLTGRRTASANKIVAIPGATLRRFLDQLGPDRQVSTYPTATSSGLAA